MALPIFFVTLRNAKGYAKVRGGQKEDYFKGFDKVDIGTQVFWLIILSLVVASIAWTVTQEEIFREWRDVCADKSKSCNKLVKRKFFYVFTCEYCFSHWVTVLVLILTGFRLLLDDWRGYILAFFVIPWMANQLMSIYRRLRVGIKHEDALATEVKERLDNE